VDRRVIDVSEFDGGEELVGFLLVAWSTNLSRIPAHWLPLRSARITISAVIPHILFLDARNTWRLSQSRGTVAPFLWNSGRRETLYLSVSDFNAPHSPFARGRNTLLVH